MTNKADIINGINPRYFWDIDMSKLDIIVAKRLIIERVFSLGKLDEMNEPVYEKKPGENNKFSYRKLVRLFSKVGVRGKNRNIHKMKKTKMNKEN